MIELEPVAVDDVRFARLAQLYVHEWSELLPDRVSIGSDALFPIPDDFARHRARLFVDDRGVDNANVPLGFALTSRDTNDVSHVEEFFVVAGARRHGVGLRAARALFDDQPGAWTLTVREENARALSFWRRVAELVDERADERIEIGDDGVKRTRFSFVVGVRKLG